MKRLALMAVLCWPILTAGSCATTGEPRIVTREVLVPVHGPCTVAEPAEPTRLDTDEAIRSAPGLFERVQILLAGREQRKASENAARVWGRACAR